MSMTTLPPVWASIVMAVSLLAGCATAPAERNVDRDAAKKRAEVHLQLAVGYYSRGQFDTAQEEIQKALQINSSSVDAYNVQGLIHMTQGQSLKAENSFQKAVAIAPDNPELLNNYGWFLCQNGREKESIQYFEKVLKNRAYQNQSRVMNNAGICSMRLKEVNAAESYFLSAFENDPSNQTINTNLADLYHRRNELQRAQFYINRALKADNVAADTLWLAVRIERKLGDDVTASTYANQLRRRYPDSPEYAAYLRGAFNE